jgi:hypothetical protein
MSLWKAKLLDQLRSSGINGDDKRFASVRVTDNPMALWIELRLLFEDAHRGSEDGLIRSVYEYASWCVDEAPRATGAEHDPATAAMVCFYEHLPKNPSVRDRIHEFMTWDEVQRIKSAFGYFLGDVEAKRFLKELKERYRKPISKSV